MNNSRSSSVTRRDFLAGTSALGATSLLGFARVASAEPPPEPPPEITRIRLNTGWGCTSPLYIAEELLRAEGFSDVQYLADNTREIGTSKLIATGAADLDMSFGMTTLLRVDAGEPVAAVAADYGLDGVSGGLRRDRRAAAERRSLAADHPPLPAR